MSNEPKNQSVGSKVHEILSTNQHEYQVQEIIDEYADKYVKEVQECVEKNWDRFESPFYVVVLHKKEAWAMNVLRNWFVARQTKPSMKTMWTDYRNFMHTVYEVNKRSSDLKLLWTLPSPDEARVILQNWHLYDQDLVRWCHKAQSELKAA